MTMLRPARFVLLMLFALLQCVAPLSHAHVNGDNSAQRVHIAVADMPWSHGHDQPAGAVHLSAGEHHSAVVCTPPEYRCSALATDQPAAASLHALFVSREHAAAIVIDYYPQPLPLTPYQRPGSQAPPV